LRRHEDEVKRLGLEIVAVTFAKKRRPRALTKTP